MWESREDRQRCNDEVGGPIIAQLGGTRPAAAAPDGTEFEVRGPVLPGGGTTR